MKAGWIKKLKTIVMPSLQSTYICEQVVVVFVRSEMHT